MLLMKGKGLLARIPADYCITNGICLADGVTLSPDWCTNVATQPCDPDEVAKAYALPTKSTQSPPT